MRELDERLGLSELVQQHLTDPRGKNTQFPLADLLGKSVFSRLAWYEDVNDVQQLSKDPTFRLIDSVKISERGAALTSRLQSFETEGGTRGNRCWFGSDQPRFDRQGRICGFSAAARAGHGLDRDSGLRPGGK